MANISAGESICGQELGEVIFEMKFWGLFFTWNLRLAKSSKTMSGNLRSSSESEPLSKPYASPWEEAGFAKPHSVLLICWEIKGFFSCPLRSIKKGKTLHGRAHHEQYKLSGKLFFFCYLHSIVEPISEIFILAIVFFHFRISTWFLFIVLINHMRFFHFFIHYEYISHYAVTIVTSSGKILIC